MADNSKKKGSFSVDAEYGIGSMDNMVRNFEYASFSIADIVNTFPEIAHVKEALTGKYVLTNNNNINLFGFEDKRELLGKTVFDLAKYMGKKWPKGYAGKIKAYDDQVALSKKPLTAKPNEFLNERGFVVSAQLERLR